jgi:hypothetical protein
LAIAGASLSMIGNTEGMIRSAKGVFDFFFKVLQFIKGRVVTRYLNDELIPLQTQACRTKVHIFVVRLSLRSSKTVGYPLFNLSMKKCILVLFISFIAGFSGSLFAQNRFWVASSAANWNNAANWSATSGGPGGASIPGTGGSEVAVFNGNGLGDCNLDISPLVSGITVNGYTGTINLQGRNLTTTGVSNIFTTGTISNSGAAAALVLNTTGSTTFNGTLFNANANISGNTGRLLFNGSTFNGSVSIIKTDNNTDNGNGGNTFNNMLTIGNAGTGELRLGNANPDIFNSLIININNTGDISVARTSAGNQLNQNITINYNSTGQVLFGANGGTSTLANGRTIAVGTVGGSGCGNLSLARVTQVGGTAQTITLSGNTTATLSFNNSNFAAAVNLTSPRYAMSASTFQGAVTMQKTDGAADNLTGGNTFQSITLVTNSGSGELNFGNTNPDIFNNNLTLTNTSTGRIQIGLNAAGNMINGNLTVNHGGNSTINTIIGRNAGATVTINGTVTLNNSNADPGAGIIVANDAAVTINGNIIVSSNNGRGVYFGNGSGSVTQTAGNITTGTFSGGTLSFSRFTQTSTVANTATLTGSTTLNINNSSVFGGSVNFTAPMFTSNGTTYNGAAILEKTTGSDNYWGGNTFHGVTTITNTSSAELILGNANADTFNGITVFNNTGGYRIRIAYNHNGQTTTFAQSVTLNSNKSGGTDPWSFLIGENANSNVTFSGSLTINVAGSLRSDYRFLNGAGTIGTFTGPVVINETNTHASTIVTMGVNGTSTYAENIVVTNSGGTNGVVFNSGASSSSTLAPTKTITIGAGGFTAGTLSLQRFIQTGPTDQTLTAFSGSASLVLGPSSEFGGNITFSAPRLFLNGVTVAGIASLEKNGAADDYGAGGNVFQGVTTITHSGSGYLLTGGTNADQFASTSTFNVIGSGRMHLAQNHGGQTTTFASDVVFNINKTGAVDQWGILFCEGANTGITFGGNLTILNAGSFRSDTRFLNGTGSSAVYNGIVTVNVTNSNSSTIQNMGTNGQSTFNENIIVSNSGGSTGVYFNTGTSSSSSLSTGKTITIGAGGFTSGSLSLPRFTQLGATSQTLNPTGTAALIVGPNSRFDGNVNFVSPRLLLNGCIYGGTGNFEKTGDLDDAGSGGNVFTGVTTITNSGLRYLLLGNGTRDQFLSATTFNNTGSYRIYFGHSHPGQTTEFASDLTLNTNKSGGTDGWSYLVAEGSNTGLSIAGNLVINCAGSIQSNHRFLTGAGTTGTFNTATINVTNTHPSTSISMGETGTSTYSGNISVSNSGGAAGITFNLNATASSTMTGAISAGVFSSGSLNLYRFAQIGNTPQNLTLTVDGTILRSGPGSNFEGPVNFISPRILLSGTTYQQAAYLEKIGANDDYGSGGNIFDGTTTLVNSGAGILFTANSAPDIFNGDLTVTNSGSNYIFLAYNVPGNEFNGNIILNNTGSALGIRFAHNTTGAATFAAGTNRTIAVGVSGFSVGELGLRRFTQTGSSPQTLTLTGSARLISGPSSEFNGNVSFTAPRILLNGTLYNGTAYLEKTSTTNDDGIGGNTFMQTTTLVNSGSNYLLTGATNPDIFAGTLILLNNGSSTIRLADNSAGNQFNGNIELNSASGGGIYFGNNVNGTSTLAATRTIAVGTSGFITGDVRLIRFTQVGATPQTLNLGGIAILTLGPSSTFDGDINFRSPQLLLNGTTFNGTSILEKKGAGDNYSNGGNTFVGSSTIIDSGAGYLAMALNFPDIFQSDLTVTNQGSNIIYLANNVTGNQFNGNITFNSTLGSGGIYIGNNPTASATLGNGASLLTGGLGFNSGELRLKRLTQIGNSAQTLTLTGTALLRIGPATTFNGSVNFRSPQIALDGAIYNGITYLEKTGAANNDSAGGNSFLGGTTTIANSGTGWFRFSLTTLDTFGTGDLILTNTGTSTIRMADNIPGSVFNGNIFVNSTNGGGIYFSESGGGTATLGNGKSIAVGGTGFTLGDLRIRRFTQADAATPQTLLLTGTSSLVLGPVIAFSGNSDFRAPQLFLEGGVFNGTAFLEKTGATDNGSTGNMLFQSTTTIRLSGTGYLRTNGGNTFNGTTSLINTGSNYLLLELATGSTYNGNLTLTNTGSNRIRSAYTGTTAFNGNIVVNNTNGLGIYFVDNGVGSAILAAGRTISVGGTGFTVGELSMPRFTQTGNTAQNLVLTGTSTFRTGPTAVWNGDLTASSPAVFLDGTTFNGTTNSINKTGATTDTSIGGNIFSAGTTSTLINSGTGIFRLANVTGDDFAGNVIFNQAAGTLQPAYNVASTFRGNVTVTSAAAITFGAAAGVATFTGTTNQNVSKGGAASPIFRRLTMNKAAGTVTLATDATVSTTATFTQGIINTTAANYLNFADDATTTGANNTSFVDGPVRKTGNDPFTFPIGDATFYRPAGISAPTGTAHFFTAQYFKADHGFASVGDPSFTSISRCEYWIIDRNTAPTSNVLVTLSWQEAACVPGYITNPATLRVARWNGSSWVNHGNGGTTGTATNGTVVTSSAVTSFSPFTLASVSLANPLPVELTWFKASITTSGTGLLQWHTESELNNDRFEIERSVNGIDFTTLGSVNGAGTSNQAQDYEFEDKNPVIGLAYYRLKQVDFIDENGDENFEYSSLVSLDLTEAELGSGRFLIAPNPATGGSFVTFKSNNRTILQTVTVYNNLNQVVREYSDVEGFSTEGLAAGIYIVKNKAGEVFRLVIK